ncbi:MAG TPA: DNA polymerase III subunit gamma/tau [Alphaproteobacteria bacterium]|jgi:DNA polymerase-3 subunit gamma/tau
MSDEAASANAYRVLARKYRPSSFATLIGQEALVRTLSNAIRSGRLAHAWLLTGVRGVGKTTTARIIARALNCVGPDGKGGPTPEPCGVCEHCVAIAEDRHVDVMEMDAASRTGVDDVRELIEGVRYRPVSARYKVYIIDEVHMLSNNAFNALLKTLEEPPEHVKFIFATTESRKIPVTVLSRCQRFDLRRFDESELAKLLSDVAGKEKVDVEPAALALIARAADGSARDGLSILDQAISHGLGADAATIGEALVRDMLGLADRTRVFDLFESVMKGDVAKALAVLGEQHVAGADAATVIEDLLELVHWITRIKVAPDVAKDVTVPEAERVRGSGLATTLSMPSLARAWQMLLKGLQETQSAPNPMQAAEMILVRLAYAAELPPPGDLVKSLTQNGAASASATASARTGAPATTTARAVATTTMSAVPTNAPTMMAAPSLVAGGGASQPVAMAAPQAAPQPASDAAPMPQSFRDVAALFDRKREAILFGQLVNDAHLVRFEPGRIELRPEPHAPRDFTNRVGSLLTEWTGQRWIVSVSQDRGDPTLAEQNAQSKRTAHAEAAAHPFVRAAMEMFPGARILEVKTANVTPAVDAPVAGEGFDGEVPLSDEAPPGDEAPSYDDAPPPDEGAYGGDLMPDPDGDFRP